MLMFVSHGHGDKRRGRFNVSNNLNQVVAAEVLLTGLSYDDGVV